MYKICRFSKQDANEKSGFIQQVFRWFNDERCLIFLPIKLFDVSKTTVPHDGGISRLPKAFR